MIIWGQGGRGGGVSVKTIVLKRYKKISYNIKEVLYYKVAKWKYFVLDRGIFQTDWGVDQLLNLSFCQTSSWPVTFDHIENEMNQNFHPVQLFQFLSVCSESLFLAELSSEILDEMQLEMLFTIHALKQTSRSHTSNHKIKILSLWLVNFLYEYKVSSLVIGSNIDN